MPIHNNKPKKIIKKSVKKEEKKSDARGKGFKSYHSKCKACLERERNTNPYVYRGIGALKKPQREELVSEILYRKSGLRDMGF